MLCCIDTDGWSLMKYLRSAKSRATKREAVEHEPESPLNKKQYKGKYPFTESMIITNSYAGYWRRPNSHDRHVKLLQLEDSRKEDVSRFEHCARLNEKDVFDLQNK